MAAEFATLVEPLPLGRAADELIQALEAVEDLTGYRLTLLQGVRLGQRIIDVEQQANPSAQQALAVVMALDALADAVDARRSTT